MTGRDTLAAMNGTAMRNQPRSGSTPLRLITGATPKMPWSREYTQAAYRK